MKYCSSGFNFFQIKWQITWKCQRRLLGCSFDGLVNWLHSQYCLQLFRLGIIPRLERENNTVKQDRLPSALHPEALVYIPA